MILKKLIKSMDNPETVTEKSLIWFSLILTYLTVFSLIIEEILTTTYRDNVVYFNFLEYIALTFFSVEYVSRILTSKKKIKYLFSFYGIVDALSVIPSLFGILSGSSNSSLWVRVFKVFRLFRLLKLIKLSDSVGGVVGQLIPYFATAIAFKGIVVVFENQSWWIEFSTLNVVIGVVGFALAILLGTKLGDVHSRISAIEDTVCRIVGSLRDMQNQKEIKSTLLEWSIELEKSLKSPIEKKKEMAMIMREKTDALEEKLESASIGGAATAGFHRDVSNLLHQMTRKTPPAYDKFLRYVVVIYSIVVVLAVPGLVGFISSLLIVYILGGMYILIDDMDKPLDYVGDSYFDARLDSLEYYNKTKFEVCESNEKFDLIERTTILTAEAV